ncbi:MAG: hypothetical protein AB7N76_10385 [Planctomycetota bacterium]
MRAPLRLLGPLLLPWLLVPAVQARERVVALGYDAITTPGRRVELRAKFEGAGIGPLRRDLKRRAVRFRLLDQEATARTDGDGVAAAGFAVPTSGTFPFTAELLEARGRPTAHATLRVVDPARPVAVIDIDGTLSSMSGVKVLFRGDRAETYPGAAELVKDLARTHEVVYLSARDDAFMRDTRVFLARHGFPGGALLMNDWGLDTGEEREQLRPGKHGEFKLRVLEGLRARGLRLTLGIGDADTDAWCYAQAKLAGYIHRPKGDRDGLAAGSVVFRDYAELRVRLVEAGTLPAGGAASGSDAAPRPSSRQGAGPR